MITRLKIENFKSIGSPGLDIELKPLTILVGPNGSGKSNIMQALAFLGAQAGNQTGRELKSETLVVARTSEMLDMIHKRDPRKWLTLETHMAPDVEQTNRLVFWRNQVDQERLGIIMPPIGTIGYKFSWENEREQSRQSVFMDRQEIMRAAHVYKSEKRAFKDAYESPKLVQGVPVSTSPLFLLAPHVFRPTFREKFPEARALTNLAEEIVTIIALQVQRKAFLISTLRGEVPYSPETTQPPPTWVGMKGENVVQILSLLGQRRYKKKREKIMKWAARFRLVDVGGTWSGWDKLVSDYADPDLGTALNAALASHGSKQMLSIIVQLFWSEPRDLIMIEEPEISLHPDSQALLPELFSEAMSEGKQVIITTHSEFLLLAMSRPIRKKLIKPDDIAVYHVTKDSKGTHAEPLEVTAEGYVKGWVLSFAETEQKLIKEWLQTLTEEE